MKRIGHFEKVSLKQFAEGWKKYDPTADEKEIGEIYERIRLPHRATAGSAGYDFFAPVDITIKPQEETMIPTGIRAVMDADYVLILFPRSSLGFKYRLQLNNTAGIIDSDYAGAENEGHIFCKLTNDTHENKTMVLKQGQGMVQGIFLNYGITDDDAAERERTGGFGSTDGEEVITNDK